MADITVTLYSSSFCGACTSTRLTLDRVESVLDDRVAFREVNIANSPDEGEALRIEATPTVVMTKADGTEVRFDAVLRIDTPGEADYYRNGGILHYVLRQLVRS